MMLTQQLLKEYVNYDPTTGIFTWRKKTGKGKIGARVGSKHSCGYLEARIAGHRCFLHRAAWIYVTGNEPKYIDHINGQRDDNRWDNLREATNQQNVAHRINKNRNNTSGIRGVYFSKKNQKWIANIHFEYKTTYLGSFSTKEEASAARSLAAKTLFGDFAGA